MLEKFNELAPRIAVKLVADFGISNEDAAAIVGNLAHECSGFTQLQEEKPLVPGSRGGWGWAQWTGPRRLQFEAWVARQNLEPHSFEANYSFLYRELTGTEKAALRAVKAASGLLGKTKVFMNVYLRPGVPNLTNRFIWAERVMALLSKKE